MTSPIDWFASTIPLSVVATRAYTGPAMLADMSRTTTPVVVPCGRTAARPAPADLETMTDPAIVAARASTKMTRTNAVRSSGRRSSARSLRTSASRV
jgi:hypothetical protein